jgi:Toprim domain-containing protein
MTAYDALADYSVTRARTHTRMRGNRQTRHELSQRHGRAGQSRRMRDAFKFKPRLLRHSICCRLLPVSNEVSGKGVAAGKVLRVPCMIAAIRDIRTNEIVAIQRTRLSPVGRKIDRRMWGPAGGAAIKLDADEAATHGLAIGEGTETCLTARQLGLRPAWAIGSKDQIAKFPVLSGIESLTILAEPGAEAQVRVCAEGWRAPGREVLLNRPISGSDLNDAWRGVA